MKASSSLRDAGVTVHQVEEPSRHADGGLDAVIDATIGEVTERFVVDVKARAPHPNEVDQLAARLHRTEDLGNAMVVAPYVSASVGEHLTAAGVSWADGCGNFDLRTPVLVCPQRMSNSPPRAPRTSLPQGSGSLGITRCLIGFSDSETEEHSATALATQAAVSQPRASQVLHQLLDLGLVERTQSRRWLPHRERLLDRFLTGYHGPGGSERFLYSLDPPAEVAVAAASVRRGRVAVSGIEKGMA